MATYNGTNLGDLLTGSRYSSDILNGYDGDDVLDGSRGNDVLNGGKGNDILKAGYDYGQGDVFNGGEGIDTYVIAGTEVDHFAFDVDLERGTDRYNNQYIDIENIVGGDRDDELSGNEANNDFEGGRGNDVLNGRGGQDNLKGGEGNDVVVGGQADNAIMTALADAKTGTRDEIGKLFSQSSNNPVDPTEADTLSGDAGNDLLLGMRGNDALSGGEGADVLYGNSGDDKIDGGSGNDTIYGGKGNDVIVDGTGNDVVTGDSGDDTVIAGKGGDDSYVGGSGNDTIDYSLSGADGLKVDLSKGRVSGDDHNDTLNGFEKLVATSGDDAIKGSKNAETIDAGAGDDTIRGYKGADTLVGGEGADTFDWERKDLDAADTIEDFVAGTDTLDFSNLVKSTKYDDVSDVIRTEQFNEGTLVQVYSGNDLGWQDVVLLEDVYTNTDELDVSGSMLF